MKFIIRTSIILCMSLSLWGVTLAQQSELVKSIDKEIKVLQKETSSSIKRLNDEHKKLRKELEFLVADLYLDRLLIFGKDDKYLKPGLHRYFVTPPKTLDGYYDRNPQNILLEEKHVMLYELDVDLFSWKGMESALVNRTKIKSILLDDMRLDRTTIKKRILDSCISHINITQSKLRPYLDDFYLKLINKSNSK